MAANISNKKSVSSRIDFCGSRAVVRMLYEGKEWTKKSISLGRGR